MGIDSLEDVANIVTFIAPGYFVIQAYSMIYAKRDRDFSRLLIESVVYSLPIVAIVNVVWKNILGWGVVSSIDMRYVLLLAFFALLASCVVVCSRKLAPVQKLANKIGIGSPHEDFVKTQLLRINSKNPDSNAVTVRLKDGTVFSGTIDQISRYSHTGPNYYYFKNLAWFNEKSSEWDERDGGIIIRTDDVEYIETPKLSDK
jgi:hypothetical protein